MARFVYPCDLTNTTSETLMRFYSSACEQVIRMLAVLPQDDPKAVFSPGKIARKAKVKESYARKGLQSLSQAGILTAVTGPGGGYCLARDPRKIRLLEVVQAIDGRECFDACVLGLPSCGSKNKCPLHDSWVPLKENIYSTLDALSLWELMKAAHR